MYFALCFTFFHQFQFILYYFFFENTNRKIVANGVCMCCVCAIATEELSSSWKSNKTTIYELFVYSCRRFASLNLFNYISRTLWPNLAPLLFALCITVLCVQINNARRPGPPFTNFCCEFYIFICSAYFVINNIWANGRVMTEHASRSWNFPLLLAVT